MKKLGIYCLLFLLLQCFAVKAQDIDSTLDNLQQIPTKYISSINKKAEQYTNRITNKTTKTLTKLSRWENKIKSLLEKARPHTAAQLFAPGQPTFTSLLEQVKQGEALALSYQAQYNKYTDDITTSLKYIAQQKDQLDSGFIKKATTAHQKMKALANEEDKTEALQQFIKDRKKQLISQAMVHIGQSKYLVKINKEAFYYAEALKNYKEIFNDSKKAEEIVKSILNKIPAFQEFIRQNSMLSGLFDIPGQNAVLQPGMQTRAGVQQLIQGSLSVMGANAKEMMNKNLQAAHSQLNDLQKKLANGYSSGEMPDFKIDQTKSKTFKQRLVYGFNIQFSKSNGIIPSATEIAGSIGFKLNDKSLIGLSTSYKLGMGSIDNIRFSNEGIGLRSFLDWKLKKQLFITGGFEMNYITNLYKPFNNPPLEDGGWQKAALLGISKRINIKTKWFKNTKLQLLYDFLSRQHVPVSQQVLFRVGYEF
jgi:hypothetical protein